MIMKNVTSLLNYLIAVCFVITLVNQVQAQSCSTVKDGPFSDPTTFTCTGGATSPPSLTFSGTIDINHVVSIPSGTTVQINGLTTINVSGGGKIDLGNSSELSLTNVGSSIYLATSDNNIRGGNNHTVLNLGSSSCDGPFEGNENNNGNGTNIQGPKILNQSTGCAGIAPDLTPTIYARPSTLYGNVDFTVVVDIVEINSVPTSGLITVKVTKDARMPFSFDASLTSVGGRDVQNSSWMFKDDMHYYILTTTQSINGGDKLSFGLSGMINPNSTSGSMTISTTVDKESGGEDKKTNNSDADKADYFQQ